MNDHSQVDTTWQELPKPGVGKGPRVPILLQYWNALWRHRLLVLATFVVCILAAAVLTGLASPKYTANAQIEIARDQARVTNVDGLESERAGQNQEFYYTQYELLRARSLAERVVRELGLARSEEFFGISGAVLDDDAMLVNGAGVSSATIKARENRAIDLVQANMNVVPVRGSALVRISYVSEDPVWSARLANAFAEEFIQSSLDRKFSSTAEARKFLEGRLEILRASLDKSERELVDYAVSQNLVGVQSTDPSNDSVQTLTELDLSTLNAKLAEAVSERIDAQASVRALAGRRDNGRTVDNAALNGLRQKRAEVAGELAALLVQFEPEYPPARALREQIAALDRAIGGEQGRIANAANGALDAAQLRENQLRATVDSLVNSLVREERSGIRYGILKREVDTNRELYDGLLQRYKEIGVAGVGSNNIAIVDRAIPPEFPSSPNLLLNLIVATLLGGLLATGIVLVLENLDQGIRDPAMVQQQLGLPLLGVIPESDQEFARDDLNDRKSEMSEAYATVQSNLAFSTDHGVPRKIMFTSTDKAEGKSTSAYALATGLARAGRKVILVDADMRLPTLDHMIGKRGTDGLSNYLAGDDDLNRMMHETEQSGMSVLTSGPIPPSAPELLGSERLLLLTQVLEQKFDHIVFDSPPMLGLADATLISRVVEGAVFVAEAERGAIRMIGEAIARLRKANARIYGLVVTKYAAGKNGYGYSYSYSYSYGSDRDKGADREARRGASLAI